MGTTDCGQLFAPRFYYCISIPCVRISEHPCRALLEWRSCVLRSCRGTGPPKLSHAIQRAARCSDARRVSRTISRWSFARGPRVRHALCADGQRLTGCPLTIVGGVRERFVLRAAGAGRQCAPAALVGRFWAAPQLHRFRGRVLAQLVYETTDTDFADRAIEAISDAGIPSYDPS